MDSKTLATSFIKSFCEADLEGIGSLLSTQFKLKGPLFEFDSKQDLLNHSKVILKPIQKQRFCQYLAMKMKQLYSLATKAI